MHCEHRERAKVRKVAYLFSDECCSFINVDVNKKSKSTMNASERESWIKSMTRHKSRMGNFVLHGEK